MCSIQVETSSCVKAGSPGGSTDAGLSFGLSSLQSSDLHEFTRNGASVSVAKTALTRPSMNSCSTTCRDVLPGISRNVRRRISKACAVDALCGDQTTETDPMTKTLRLASHSVPGLRSQDGSDLCRLSIMARLVARTDFSKLYRASDLAFYWWALQGLNL
jgi:hypothetical protein